MRKHVLLSASSLVAGALAAALFLRPSRTGHESLPEPARIPPAARHVLEGHMQRHGAQLRDLVLSVIVMDDDRAARIAGEIYDEPTLARPVRGDELNGLLPERFFVQQDELKAGARRLVAALARKDRAAIGDDLALLTRTCIACHEAYLGASPDLAVQR